MDWELHRHYTREEINAELGGSIQSYLPQVGGRVVCRCFKCRRERCDQENHQHRRP
jgi:hypothetical protein